ncbi:metallophosphoesterase family protein [Polyangium sp. 6x1]|uniref:metallophosphoesterase family protein n=1 Tax=Polyangium sp. 6x1 TaxID=3042689 RepID=UPI0024824FDB|nr:metallophosphoesterase family protein [Polyangium sp. 6x1]MDI1446120.1 metallophosphoesterase family protein [Polyangium sp. 6x1]
MTTLRRVGFLGDVHAEDERLARAIDVLEAEGASQLACVGDIIDGKGDFERVVDLLHAHRVVTVRGNHERWFLADDMRDLPDAHGRDRVSESARAYIASLPAMVEIPTIAGSILLCHGLGADDMTGVQPWDADTWLRHDPSLQRLLRTTSMRFVLNGHTHRRLVRPIEDRLFINAGTLYRDHDPSFGLLDLEASVVRTWLFDSDLSVQEIAPTPFDLAEPPPTPKRPPA